MDNKQIEMLYPTFVKYMADKGYATTSDSKTIIIKWYGFLEWSLSVGKELNAQE